MGRFCLPSAPRRAPGSTVSSSCPADPKAASCPGHLIGWTEGTRGPPVATAARGVSAARSGVCARATGTVPQASRDAETLPELLLEGEAQEGLEPRPLTAARPRCLQLPTGTLPPLVGVVSRRAHSPFRTLASGCRGCPGGGGARVPGTRPVSAWRGGPRHVPASADSTHATREERLRSLRDRPIVRGRDGASCVIGVMRRG